MEVINAASLIRVLVDHNQHYPSSMRRELLEGVYEMATACLQTIDSREDSAREEETRREIVIATRLIEGDLLSGNLTEGFLVALDCFNKAEIESRISASYRPAGDLGWTFSE